MFKLVVLVAAAVAVCSGLPRTRVPTLDGRIVGGSDADIVDYPYQLSLQYSGQHFCGAVLIGDNWALTAGHCVEDYRVTGLTVRAGSSVTSSGGQVVSVSEIILHPQYDSWRVDFDAAVLKLSEPVTVANASPAALPEPDTPLLAGSEAFITGWGTLTPGGTVPDILQVIDVPIVSQEDCRSAYGSSAITDRMFCAGLFDVGGKDACQGDSGGPVLVNKSVVGLVSWGVGCAEPKYPGVYTNVASVRPWIKEQTGL